MKNRKIFRIFSLMLALLLLAVNAVPQPVYAEDSASIKEEIEALEADRDALQAQINEIDSQKDENWESIEEKVAYKNNIDSQIFLIYSEIDNLNAQIASYSQLIADTQKELDTAQQRLDDLEQKNKERIRAIEEEGEISYWSVLFRANSFTDLIDWLNMIEEIQAADVRRMSELSAAAEEVAAVKQTLSEEKTALQASMTELEAAQAELDEKRAETDQILAELMEEDAAYQEILDGYEDEKAALLAEIAAQEVEYTKALEAEEEARRQAEAEKNQQNNSNNNQTSTNAPSVSGWLMPCSYVYISSPYGYRSSGWHNGVDFAAYRGTPIYATRAGTVTTAVSLTYSYGNYVVVNHGDGFSSLYAHMDYFVVSQGQYVSQGQLIGYVGSTGNSTGNHLHLTFFYNGSTVNPMDYL